MTEKLREILDTSALKLKTLGLEGNVCVREVRPGLLGKATGKLEELSHILRSRIMEAARKIVIGGRVSVSEEPWMSLI